MAVTEACVFLGCLEPGSWTELIGALLTFASVVGGLGAFFLKVSSDKKTQAKRLVTAPTVSEVVKSSDRTTKTVTFAVENTSDQSFYQPQFVQQKYKRTWLTWIPGRRRNAIYMTSGLRPQDNDTGRVIGTLPPGGAFTISTSIDDQDETRLLLVFTDAAGNVWTRNLRTKVTKRFKAKDAALFSVFRDPMQDLTI